jgi:hypothetical protein
MPKETNADFIVTEIKLLLEQRNYLSIYKKYFYSFEDFRLDKETFNEINDLLCLELKKFRDFQDIKKYRTDLTNSKRGDLFKQFNRIKSALLFFELIKSYEDHSFKRLSGLLNRKDIYRDLCKNDREWLQKELSSFYFDLANDKKYGYLNDLTRSWLVDESNEIHDLRAQKRKKDILENLPQRTFSEALGAALVLVVGGILLYVTIDYAEFFSFVFHIKLIYIFIFAFSVLLLFKIIKYFDHLKINLFIKSLIHLLKYPIFLGIPIVWISIYLNKPDFPKLKELGSDTLRPSIVVTKFTPLYKKSIFSSDFTEIDISNILYKNLITEDKKYISLNSNDNMSNNIGFHLENNNDYYDERDFKKLIDANKNQDHLIADIYITGEYININNSTTVFTYIVFTNEDIKAFYTSVTKNVKNINLSNFKSQKEHTSPHLINAIESLFLENFNTFEFCNTITLVSDLTNIAQLNYHYLTLINLLRKNREYSSNKKYIEQEFSSVKRLIYIKNMTDSTTIKRQELLMMHILLLELCYYKNINNNDDIAEIKIYSEILKMSCFNAKIDKYYFYYPFLIYLKNNLSNINNGTYNNYVVIDKTTLILKSLKSIVEYLGLALPIPLKTVINMLEKMKKLLFDTEEQKKDKIKIEKEIIFLKMYEEFKKEIEKVKCVYPAIKEDTNTFLDNIFKE